MELKIKTWPDITRFSVDGCALMEPGLRINGYPGSREVMQLVIVTQDDPVNNGHFYLYFINRYGVPTKYS